MRHHPNTNKSRSSCLLERAGNGLGRSNWRAGTWAAIRTLRTGSNTKEKTTMKKHLTKKRVVFAAIVIVALGIAGGVAFAYWTSTGTGSSAASVAAGSDVSIVITDMGADLYPGGSATVKFHVHNNSTTNSVQIGKVVQDGPVTGLPASCLASDFSFGDVSANQTIAANSDGADLTGTLSMANTAANQDACKSQAPVLHLKIDNTGL
jgi:hypothetical protein